VLLLIKKSLEVYCKAYTLLFWNNDLLISSLIESLALHPTIKSIVYEIFELLLTSPDYSLIIEEVHHSKVGLEIIRSLELIDLKETETIRLALKMISRILEKEKRLFKFDSIKIPHFTESVRDSGLGSVIRDIYERHSDHSVKELAFNILSQCFIQYKGSIKSIRTVCKDSRFKANNKIIC
jgi:hypothetical protein